MNNEYKFWLLKREYAIKVLNCAYSCIEKKMDFVEVSKEIEALLSEFERDCQSLGDKNELPRGK